ncbi:MAG: hypothetical protein WEA29_04790 [Acidimicrobiia bacterium]
MEVLWAVTVAAWDPSRSDRRGVDAFAVLNHPLARGEIEPEEYRRLRSTLGEAR